MALTKELVAEWLGIPKKEWPPNAYCWLGLDDFENDPETIKQAAAALMRKLRDLKKKPENRSSEHQRTINTLMEETAHRRRVLLDEDPQTAKDTYDARLARAMKKQQRMETVTKARQAKPLPAPPPPPIAINTHPDQTKTPNGPQIDGLPVIVSASEEEIAIKRHLHPRSSRATSGRSRRQTPWSALFLGAVVGSMVGIILAYFLHVALKAFFQ
jgi:hypothetical protein